MYIKNQKFKDEETLMEVLFDFDLGVPDPYTQALYDQIADELRTNTQFQEYRNTLDQDDKMELDTEERDMRLAEILLQQFESFVVEKAKLYGVKGNDMQLLYEVELH